MSRYIDADAIIEFIDLGHYRNPLELCYSEQYVVDMIESRPTADVVEVVRCKECKYYLHSNEKCELIDTRLHFYETDNTWTEDAFCSWGERREDECLDNEI